jgi:hypothetical protein
VGANRGTTALKLLDAAAADGVPVTSNVYQHVLASGLLNKVSLGNICQSLFYFRHTGQPIFFNTRQAEYKRGVALMTKVHPLAKVPAMAPASKAAEGLPADKAAGEA